MERLTQWIDENRAIPRVDLRRCGHERCTTQLARYEDTGLTPEQIISISTELKEYKQLELSPKRLSEHVVFCRRYRALFGAIDFSRLMELVEQDTVNDGWISVEKYGFPQSNNHDFRFWITIQYDNGYRKTIKGKWDYFDKCFVYQNGKKISENVVAYKYYSMPEPYCPERSENEI